MRRSGSNILQEVKRSLRELVPGADFKVLATQVKEVYSDNPDNNFLISRNPSAIEVSYDNGSIQKAGLNDIQVMAFVENILATTEEFHEIATVTTLERTKENAGRAKAAPLPAQGFYVSFSAYKGRSPQNVPVYAFDGASWWVNGDRVSDPPKDAVRLTIPLR